MKSTFTPILIFFLIFSCTSPDLESNANKDLESLNPAANAQNMDAIGKGTILNEDSLRELQSSISIDISALYWNDDDTSQIRNRVLVDSLLKRDSLRDIYSRISETSFAVDPTAQLTRFETSWTDGFYWFGLNDRSEGNRLPYIAIFGGSRHEGGGDSRGILLNDSTILISESMYILETPSILMCTHFSGVKCFLNISLDGDLLAIMVASNFNFANDTFILINDQLAGVFVNTMTHETVTFLGNDNVVNWSNDTTYRYEFEADEYEGLDHIITFDSGSYYFERRTDTLELTKVFRLNSSDPNWKYSKEVQQFVLITPSNVLTYQKFKKNLRKHFYKIDS